MTEDLRRYNLCRISNRASLSQIKCHPDVTSDRMLRLARSAEFRQEPWARFAGDFVSERARLGCTAVRIEAIATYPVGLGLPPRLLAQPPRAVAT
jgi:hypothetical protein